MCGSGPKRGPGSHDSLVLHILTPDGPWCFSETGLERGDQLAFSWSSEGTFCCLWAFFGLCFWAQRGNGKDCSHQEGWGKPSLSLAFSESGNQCTATALVWVWLTRHTCYDHVLTLCNYTVYVEPRFIYCNVKYIYIYLFTKRQWKSQVG